MNILQWEFVFCVGSALLCISFIIWLIIRLIEQPRDLKERPIELEVIMTDSLCTGSGKTPAARRRTTGIDIDAEFNRQTRGCCPDEGCDVPLLSNGKLTDHEVNSGAFMRAIS